MPYEFSMRRRMEFSDTDMAGIVHFANLFRFMEDTEHAFIRSLGFRVHAEQEGRMNGMVRVHAECDYHQPLRYQDELEIRLLVERRGRRSLRYRFLFFKTEDRGVPLTTPLLSARGALSVVSVNRDVGQDEIIPAELPAELLEQIEEAPPELWKQD
jgi:YbgC/YbaW family acyl-CoA thioester hydrolase